MNMSQSPGLDAIVSELFLSEVHLVFSLRQFDLENEFTDRGLSGRWRSLLELASTYSSIHLWLLRVEPLLLMVFSRDSASKSVRLHLPCSRFLLIQAWSLKVCSSVRSTNRAIQISVSRYVVAIGANLGHHLMLLLLLVRPIE